MHLKQRIKKLEEIQRLSNRDGDYCDCFRKHIDSAIEAVYNDDPNTKIEIYPEPDFTRSSCAKCGKPFSSRDIQLRANIELFYGNDSSDKIQAH